MTMVFIYTLVSEVLPAPPERELLGRTLPWGGTQQPQHAANFPVTRASHGELWVFMKPLQP